jgi:hypothetical protein
LRPSRRILIIIGVEPNTSITAKSTTKELSASRRLNVPRYAIVV